MANAEGRPSYRILRDSPSGSIQITGTSIGSKFINDLKAIINDDDTITIINLTKKHNTDFLTLRDIPVLEFGDSEGNIIGLNQSNPTEYVVNFINSIFQSTGGGSTTIPNVGDINITEEVTTIVNNILDDQFVKPVITSSDEIDINDGDVINYTMTASNGVTYIFDNLPSGVTTLPGNEQTIIGVTAIGVYTVTMRSVNYFGISDPVTLTITVASLPFGNTRSIEFEDHEYLTGTATIQHPMYRSGTTSDGWTFLTWIKSSSSSDEQTLIYFGDNNYFFRVVYDGGNHSVFVYIGKHNKDYIRLDSNANSMSNGIWQHIIVTYDGGKTGDNSGDINDYYSRFKIFRNGVELTLTGSHDHHGYTGNIQADLFYIGRSRGGSGQDFMQDETKLDEVVLWDEPHNTAAKITELYNGGTVVNFNDTITGVPTPNHWWRMGDDDIFPTIQDNIGDLDLTATNMVASDIVNDVP